MTDINKEENGTPGQEAVGLVEAAKKENGGKKHQHKDWLAVGGIGIEKRRRSSNASYRIENNKVMGGNLSSI